MHFIRNEKGLKYNKTSHVIENNSFQKILALITQPKPLEKNKVLLEFSSCKRSRWFFPAANEPVCLIKCHEFSEGEAVVEYHAFVKVNAASLLTPIKTSIKKIRYRATPRRRESPPLQMQPEARSWKRKKFKVLKAIKRARFVALKKCYQKNCFQQKALKTINKPLQLFPNLFQFKDNKHLFYPSLHENKTKVTSEYADLHSKKINRS